MCVKNTVGASHFKLSCKAAASVAKRNGRSAADNAGRRRERRAPQRCEGLAFRGAAAVHEDVVGSAVGFLQPGGGGEEVIREVEIQGFRQTEAGKHQR